MSYRKRMAALLCAAVILTGGAGFVIAQNISVPAQARIAVQKHDNGSVEVALDHGGERYLPAARFVPARAETGRWLRSSAVSFSVEAPEPEPKVVERIVEVPVEPPVVRLSVRPSDHEEGGLVCLEQADDEGRSWTWTNEEGTTSHSTELGVYTAGLGAGWAAGLAQSGAPEEEWSFLRRDAAWHTQCAAYHGVATLQETFATDPDDWRNHDPAD